MKWVKTVLLIAAILSPLAAGAAEQNAGGGLVGVDYFSPSTDPNYSEHLWAVEEYHLKPAINWLRGGSPAQAKADIDFILKHFPNHPQALALAIMYGEKTGNPAYAVPLYQQATALNPNIAGIWSDFGSLQHTLKNYAEAVSCFDKATTISPKSGMYRYNLGLSLFEQKEYERAQAAATFARDAGVPFTALQDKLDALKKPKSVVPVKKPKR